MSAATKTAELTFRPPVTPLRRLGSYSTVLIPVVGVAILFLIGDDYWIYVGSLYMVWLIAGFGMNVIVGTAGMTALHGPASMGVGAYGAVIASEHQVPIQYAVIIGALVSGVIMTALLAPTLRLQAFYFTVATFVAVLLVQSVVNQAVSLTGGPYGKFVPSPVLASLSPVRATALIVAGYLALTIVFVAGLNRSTYALRLRATRDSIDGARSGGVNVFRTRLIALFTCNVILGIAGGSLGMVILGIVPSTFGAGAIISTLLVAWIGGLDKLASPLVGALIVSVVPALLTSLQDYSDFLSNLSLFVILLLVPNGLLSLLPGASMRNVLR